MFRFFLLLCASMIASTAMAADDKPCGANLVCASKPDTIVAVLQDAGYRAKLDKDTLGDPMVSSAASGYDYDILFYGCEAAKNCSSVQFRVSFSKDDANTPELASKWNNGKRFSQAFIDSKGRFVMNYDVTTVGGLTKDNFADVVDWWAVMLGSLKAFFAANPPLKANVRS